MRSVLGPQASPTPIVVGPIPKRSESRRAVNAASSPPTLPTLKTIADQSSGEPELADRVDEEDRERDAREEVRRRGTARLGSQIGVPEHEPEPLLEIGPEADLGAVSGDRSFRALLLLPDPDQEERGPEEAHGVDEDGPRRRDQLHQAARETRARDLGRRPADLELRVPLDDLPALHERGQVGLVRDVEEDGADPDEEADDVELTHGERVGDVRDRDRGQKRCPPEVAGNQDRAPG